MPGQPPGPGEIMGVGEDVPPHDLRGVRDLLRVQRPYRAHPGTLAERRREGVACRLVRGQQYRAGGTQNRGYRQTGRLPGPRRHDREKHVLPGGTHLGGTRLQCAEQHAAIVRLHVLGLGALQTGPQIDRLLGDLPGQQIGQVPPIGQPAGITAKTQPEPGPENGCHGEHGARQQIAAGEDGGVREMRPDQPGVQERVGRLEGGPRIGAGNDVGEIAEQPGQRASCHTETGDADQEVEEEVGAGGGRGRVGTRR